MNFFRKTFWKKYKFYNLKLQERKNPTILAFSAYFHDSSACIIKVGKILAAADEERFTRKKHDNRFPENAIKYCLSEAGGAEVDSVVFYENPDEKWDRIKKTLKQNKAVSKDTYNDIVYLWENVKSKEKIQEKFQQVSGLKNKIIFLDHHLAHAASSYYVSGFNEAAIVTIDGVGEKNTTTYGYAKGNKIELYKCIQFPDSIGLMYTALTTFLGFEANSDEYKVMGLSAYGDMDKKTNKYYQKMKNLIKINDDGSFKLNMKYFGHNDFEDMAYTKELSYLLSVNPRKKEGEMTKSYENIAAALQLITEEAVFKILNYVYKETKCLNLCFAGGVALNSVLNGKILNNTPFEKIFIQPSAGDSGTVLGAAKFIEHLIDPSLPREHITHSYYGPKFTNKEIKKYLDKNKIIYLKFQSEKELINKTVKLLMGEKVIGWFHGRMEWGPRALGNRSILASPLSLKMRDVLNAKVKHREMFRPFAPVVCVDDALDFFECDTPIPEPTDYMLMVYPIKKEKQKLIPAVTHVDGSGRLQTIRKNQNPLYYKLIKEFGKQTGIPILVNTSFNVKGEPIVCAPEDAYKCMMGTEIDYLVMGKYLIKREDNFRY